MTASYLAQPIGARCLVVGDSNVVATAHPLIDAGLHVFGTATRAVVFEFAACVGGVGLRDLPDLLARLADARITEQRYDAVLVNLGVNDLSAEDKNWEAYFHGEYPEPGGLPFHERIEQLLDALPAVPVFWLGVPTGLAEPPSGPFHPWEVAAVNLAFASYDADWTATLESLHRPSTPRAGYHYVHVEEPLGSIAPRFADGLHYAPFAALALFQHVVERILATV
jgi:hypothetical protein